MLRAGVLATTHLAPHGRTDHHGRVSATGILIARERSPRGFPDRRFASSVVPTLATERGKAAEPWRTGASTEQKGWQ